MDVSSTQVQLRTRLEEAVGRKLSDDEWRIIVDRAATQATSSSSSSKRSGDGWLAAAGFVGVNVGVVLALTVLACLIYGGLLMVHDSRLFGAFLKLESGAWDGDAISDAVYLVGSCAGVCAVSWFMFATIADPVTIPWGGGILAGCAAVAIPLGGAAYALAAPGAVLHVIGGAAGVIAVAFGIVAGVVSGVALAD